MAEAPRPWAFMRVYGNGEPACRKIALTMDILPLRIRREHRLDLPRGRAYWGTFTVLTGVGALSRPSLSTATTRYR